MGNRKVYVMKWEQVELEDIKKGQVFRMIPGSDEDYKNVNPKEMCLATEDAQPLKDDNVSIMADRLVFVKQETVHVL